MMGLQHHCLLSITALKRSGLLFHDETSDIVGNLLDQFIDLFDLEDLSLVE